MTKQLSRRDFLRGAAASTAGVGALILAGCGPDDGQPTPAATASPSTPASTVPTTAPTGTPPATWAQIAAVGTAPGPRRDPSLTSIDSATLYAFGGRTKGAANAELWEFDVEQSAWEQIDASGPGARFAHNAFYDAARKRFIVALGQSDTGFFNDVWSFDPTTQAWSQLDAESVEYPSLRYGSGGAYDVEGDRILISHGFTDTGRFDDTWQFDFSTNQWSQIATTGAVPIKRCLLRTLWVPGRKEMLLFGGQTDDNPFLGDFWSLDPVTGAWIEDTAAAKPGPRNLFGADFSTGRWHAVGGNTADGPTGETWVYNVAANAWSLVATVGDLPGRYSLDAAIAGTTLYAFGGNDGSGDLSELWALQVGA